MRNKPFILGIILLSCAPTLTAQKEYKLQESKFVFMSSIGCHTGVSRINIPNKSVTNYTADIFLQQLLGYQFNNYVVAGVGTGISIWRRTAFIPLFGSLHINFMDAKITPHACINIGYAFKWYMKMQPEPLTRVIHGATSGIYGEGGVGAKFNVSPKFSVLLLIDYTLQQSAIRYTVLQPGEVDFSAYATNRSQTAFYHFVGLKLGFLY